MLQIEDFLLISILRVVLFVVCEPKSKDNATRLRKMRKEKVTHVEDEG